MEDLSCLHRSCRIALAHREAQLLRKLEATSSQRQRVLMRAMTDLARQCRQRTLALAIERWHFAVVQEKQRRVTTVRSALCGWYRLVLTGRKQARGRDAGVLLGLLARLLRHRLQGVLYIWSQAATLRCIAVQTNCLLQRQASSQTPAAVMVSVAMQTLSLFRGEVGCQTPRVTVVHREAQTRPHLRPSRMTQTRLVSRVAGTQTGVRRLVSAGTNTDGRMVTTDEAAIQTIRVASREGGTQVELELIDGHTQTAASSVLSLAVQTEGAGQEWAGTDAETQTGNDTALAARGMQTMAEQAHIGAGGDGPNLVDAITSPVGTSEMVPVGVDKGVQTDLLRDDMAAVSKVSAQNREVETVSIGSIDWGDVPSSATRASSIGLSSEVERVPPVPHGPDVEPSVASVNGEPARTASVVSLPARYRGLAQSDGAASSTPPHTVAMQTSPWAAEVAEARSRETQTAAVGSGSDVGTQTEEVPFSDRLAMGLRFVGSPLMSRMRYGLKMLVAHRLVWDNKELANLVVSLQRRLDTSGEALRDRDAEISRLRLGMAANAETEEHTGAEMCELRNKCAELERRCTGMAILETQYRELEGRCEALFEDNVKLAGSLEKALERVKQAETAEKRVEELQIMLAYKRDKAKEETLSPTNEGSLDDSTAEGIQEQLDAYMELLVDLTNKLDKSEEERKAKEEALDELKGRYELLLAGRSSTGG
ncbi:hypothetical protein FOL47_003531 [Perkinsus chesapeaki]|uniref:Uncharacterized protein n=1 Tax=Perkinsus chesapeaki TaxID=330153 RepID=A0A7J6N0X4_PERCH|nr:hypothetical protein FOL47_003531 [Perkinsus chesapeaki]